jgi:hypothetical protein
VHVLGVIGGVAGVDIECFVFLGWLLYLWHALLCYLRCYVALKTCYNMVGG